MIFSDFRLRCSWCRKKKTTNSWRMLCWSNSTCVYRDVYDPIMVGIQVTCKFGVVKVKIKQSCVTASGEPTPNLWAGPGQGYPHPSPAKTKEKGTLSPSPLVRTRTRYPPHRPRPRTWHAMDRIRRGRQRSEGSWLGYPSPPGEETDKLKTLPFRKISHYCWLFTIYFN